MSLTLTLLGMFCLAYLYRSYRRRTRIQVGTVSDIPGPDPESFLIGNMFQFLQGEAGEADMKWRKAYGDVVQFKGSFGENILLVSDPKALQYIYHTSGYNFAKPPDRRHINLLFTGPGILCVHGEEHHRHRKIIAPAFNYGQIRDYVSVFNQHASKLTAKWKEEIMESPGEKAVYNLCPWIARSTIDALGVAVFDYHFGAMEDSNNQLMKVYANLAIESFATISKKELIIQALVTALPKPVLSFLQTHVPDPRLLKLNAAYAVGYKVAKEMIETKSKEYTEGKDAKDIMSLLVRANASEEETSRLSQEEMIAEVLTLLLAGYETSANSLAWTVLELARHPAVQNKLRSEIRDKKREIRARGGKEFAASDLETMPYLAAVLKESLRFHPVSYNHYREPVKDDVLPFATPVVTRSGKVISEVVVPKGTKVITSLNGYHRNADVFGPDADTFNPGRWLTNTPRGEKQVSIGMYGNLLSFAGGVMSCLGWRFAVLEMLAYITEMVDNFEFSMTPEAEKVRREGCSLLMAPTIEGEGMQRLLPICLKIAPQEN